MLNSASVAKVSSSSIPKVLLQAKKEAAMQASGKEKSCIKLGRKAPGIRDTGRIGNNSFAPPTSLRIKILKRLFILHFV